MKRFFKITGTIILIVVIAFCSLGIIFPDHEYVITTTINAPVEKTFAVFNDTTRMKEWMLNFRSIENISGKPNEPGSKWKLTFFDHGREVVMTETMTAFEPNKVFAFDIENDVIYSRNDIRFVARNNQTDIITSVKYHGNNFFWRSMFVFFKSSIKDAQTGSYNLLKNLVEKTASAPTLPATNPYANSTIEIKTFSNNAIAGSSIRGFGYDVMIDGKLYVHQPHVPAVAGNNGFVTPEAAKKAGELVAYKIKNNIMPPSVTVNELDSIGALQ